MVVTKIGFERGVAYPSLTFKATRFVEPDELAEIEAVLNDEAETVGQITGLIENAPSNDSSEPAAPAKSDDDAPKAEAPKKKEKKAVVEEEAVAEEAESIDDIDAALDDLDFDD